MSLKYDFEKGWVRILESLLSVFFFKTNVHIDREEGDDEGAGASANTDGGDDEEGKDAPAKYTQEEKDKIKQEFQNAVMQSAKAAGAGNLPNGVKRILDKWLNPQLDWRQLLAMQIQSVIKSDYTMMNPSKLRIKPFV